MTVVRDDSYAKDAHSKQSYAEVLLEMYSICCSKRVSERCGVKGSAKAEHRPQLHIIFGAPVFIRVGSG